MSTLGKVLLFLNLLAAGGLVYVSSQDWAKRQEINGVVLRYHLTLQGLPVETPKFEKDDSKHPTLPIEIHTPSGITLETVSKKLLDAQFQAVQGGEIYGAGGTVLSMLAELERVEDKLRSTIENQQGDAGKLSYLVGGLDARGLFKPGLLLDMSESFAERDALRKLGYFPKYQYPNGPTPELVKQNLADAKARLDAKIAALKSAPNPKALVQAGEKIDELRKAVEKDPKDEVAKTELAKLSSQGSPPFTRDETDRRRRIALFLLLLDPSGSWQKRVMTVAGLKTYQTALIEQVARLTDIARQTERAMEIEQSKFDSEYELLKGLALKQDLLLTDQTTLVKGLAEMEARDAASKAARETQLSDLNKQLADLQANIAAVLTRQATAEKAVFELQRTVGETIRGNLDLEAKLDTAEQGKP